MDASRNAVLSCCRPPETVSRETALHPSAAFHVKHDPLQHFLDVITDAAQRLVADKSPEALAEHVTDARNSLPLLVGETGPLIDVGTGAGFPGVPLLIDRPELSGVLLDSRARRCEHLQEVVDSCELRDRVEVVNLRVEEYAHGAGREAFGIAVARALAPPPVAIELCLPLLRAGGVFVIHAGTVDAEQLEQAAQALGGTVEQVVPVAGFAHRSQVVIRKLGPTPEQYPRRANAIAREPLVRPAD